jgi:hypothetical protein
VTFVELQCPAAAFERQRHVDCAASVCAPALRLFRPNGLGVWLSDQGCQTFLPTLSPICPRWAVRTLGKRSMSHVFSIA